MEASLCPVHLFDGILLCHKLSDGPGVCHQAAGIQYKYIPLVCGLLSVPKSKSWLADGSASHSRAASLLEAHIMIAQQH